MQHQAPNAVHTAANRWLKAGGGGNGVRAEPHNGSESKGGEKGEALPPVSWLGSVPKPEWEAQGPALTSIRCGCTGPPVVLLEGTLSAALLWMAQWVWVLFSLFSEPQNWISMSAEYRLHARHHIRPISIQMTVA